MGRIFCSLAHKTPWTEVIQEINEALKPKWIATASTAFFLRDLGCDVSSLHDIGIEAQFLGGKVKSLHPNIYAALLADQGDEQEVTELKEAQIFPFDMAIVDIYKVQTNEEFGFDQIDIGGPAALRAAAKNCATCLPIFQPQTLSRLLTTYTESSVLRDWISNLPSAEKRKCASDVFHMMASVNHQIALELGGTPLRYGDNPEETATVMNRTFWHDHAPHEVISLDALTCYPESFKLSWNNAMDIHQALSLVHNLGARYSVCIMKHHHPCGVGYSDESLEAAFEKAYQCDPLSAYGGVVVFNKPPPVSIADTFQGLFFDLLVYPSDSKEHDSTWFKARPQQRMCVLPNIDIDPIVFTQQLHQSCFGTIRLEKGVALRKALDPTNWVVHGDQNRIDRATPIIQKAIAVVSHLHSNAICIANHEGTLGLGLGFVNRVHAITHAVNQLKNHSDVKGPVVLASDGFMPFADNIHALADSPIDIVVQPGGSKRDAEVIQAAKNQDISLVLTGSRVFFHGI